MAEAWILTVSQLNEYVRRTLAGDPMLTRVTLRGEISNFRNQASGHLYFSLKDAQARINCVMFRQYAQTLGVRLRDGMQVILTGSVGLYTRDGQYQLYAQDARADGVGDLYQQFELLKQKLSAQGLFDASIKRALPLLPRTIGVVTSPTGAVIRDIEHVARRRNPRVDILLYPARVQGTEATSEIIRGIRVLSSLPQVDVIILARGGGSIEDLWPFNEEKLAHAVRASRVPIVSAVGHETDYTIADFAADMRAPTPSAAAEIVVPRIEALHEQLDALKSALKQRQMRMFLLLRTRLEGVRAHLLAQQPSRRLREDSIRLEAMRERLVSALFMCFATRRQHLWALAQKTQALSPQAVLSRGYALLLRDGQAVSSVAQLGVGETAEVQLRDGCARVSVLSKESFCREEIPDGNAQEKWQGDV